MNTPRMLLLLLAASICAITLSAACGGSSTASPTSAKTLSAQNATLIFNPSYPVAHDIEQSVGIFRDRITSNPYYNADIQSLTYVNTTIGQLRKLFGPPKAPGDLASTVGAFKARDDTLVWAIVARGQFPTFHMGLGTQLPPTSAVWLFVLHDLAGNLSADTNDNYDISQLGEVREIPLPLAKWPTPVALEPPGP